MYRLMIASLLLAMFVAEPVQAAAFCVTTSVELQAALDTAATNGEDDTIAITVGTYSAPPGGFVYDADVPGGDVANITISGGLPIGVNCSDLNVPDWNPLSTVLDGSATERVLSVKVQPGSHVVVERLTFAHGKASIADDAGGGGLLVRSAGTLSAALIIERNVFLDNSARSGGGLEISVHTGAALYLINNLFMYNHAAHVDYGAARIVVNNGTAFVTNNTVLLNTSTTGNAGGLSLGGNGSYVVANNNLWDNQGSDLRLATATAELRNNNIGVRIGAEPATDVGNISVEPEYEPGDFNFTPVRNSPLVDAGAPPPNLLVPSPWYLTFFDLKGAARLVGPAVDIGAYENERIFADGFELPSASR